MTRPSRIPGRDAALLNSPTAAGTPLPCRSQTRRPDDRLDSSAIEPLVAALAGVELRAAGPQVPVQGNRPRLGLVDDGPARDDPDLHTRVLRDLPRRTARLRERPARFLRDLVVRRTHP